MITSWQYIAASLRHYRRIHWAVAGGVAVATAVITGALLVGHSMRASLRGMALGSLGRIDSVVTAQRPFRASWVEQVMAAPAVADSVSAAVPLLIVDGALLHEDGDAVRRAARLQILGVTPAFWTLEGAEVGSGESESSRREVQGLNLGRSEAAITQQVAEDLGVQAGDSVLLRVPLAGSVPADSVLGEKEETSGARRFTVATILPDTPVGLGRFSLRPTQQAPRNVFVRLETLQDLLGSGGSANSIALATDGRAAGGALPAATRAAIEAALRPPLDDLGVQILPALAKFGADRYFRISSDRLVLAPYAVDVAQAVFGPRQPQSVVTYLANTIAHGEKTIPYSVIVGVDSAAGLGPVLNEDGAPIVLADDEIVLNDWAARDLSAKVGDTIAIRFYEPETTHSQLLEHDPVELRLRAIVPLADAEGQPTAAADPMLAPDLPGVTDQASINDWRLPFELTEEIRPQDEAYWEEYRTTPKAFVSLQLASRLWRTRWGDVSLIRAAPEAGETAGDFAARFAAELDPARLGVTLVPVKEQALAAATGTTPFDGLFLGFSFFLMASALMLTALLFLLGVEQRAREVGLLLAVGSEPKFVRRLFLVEGALVAAVGAIVGAALGVAYARLMVWGLNTWWVAAISTPFVRFHFNAPVVVIGAALGWLVALATIFLALRRMANLPARQLLAGNAESPPAATAAGRRWLALLPWGAFASAALLCLAAIRWEGEAQAGAFFGVGALTLVGLLALARAMLRGSTRQAVARMSLAGLAARNARRNPSRSLMSLALAAMASFLIVALSAFRTAPTDRGTGGFDLVGSCELPIHVDLNSAAGRENLGFSAADNRRLANVEFVSFRVHDGEDASCLNLYQTAQPRVLGSTVDLGAGNDFAWASRRDGPLPGPLSVGDEDHSTEGGQAQPVPMVLDRNTAFYSLKLYRLGDRLTIRDGLGEEAVLQITGMLGGSILQGDVIVSEPDFLHLFPETGGYRYFLIRRQPGAPDSVDLASLLESQLEDFGFDAIDARARLADLMAVQNTYLSTFQTLGAFGLLLGVVGLAVAQLRSVQERRGELALMQATGFPRRRLATMVLLENVVLLAGGLGIGCVAALAAVLPHTVVQQVGTPWRTLALLLALVGAAGIAAGWLAARGALRAPLIPALRGE